MTINTTYAQANPIHFTGAARALEMDGMPLDAQLLIMTCRNKLKQIDAAVKQKLDQQAARNKQSSALTELTSFLNQQSTNGAVGKDRLEDFKAAYKAAWERVGENSELGMKLKADCAALDAQFHTDDDKIGQIEIRPMLDNISSYQSEITQANEVEMIQLQSRMSERTSTIQMFTNMVASIGQGLASVSQNIGK